MEKDVINWQYAPQYYELLLEMYKGIRLAYHEENYEMAFKEMEQILIHIYREVELNKKLKSKADPLKKKIDKVYTLKSEYEQLMLNSSIPDYYRLKELSGKKNEMRKEVTEIYYKVLALISDLNMFVPKIKKEDMKGSDVLGTRY